MTARPANPDILDRIPLSAQTVLGVGLHAASTLAAHRVRNPSVRLFGLLPDHVSCAEASRLLDIVAETDPESEVRPFGDQRFDCIVFDGALERMRDPWRALAQQAKLLTPQGVVLICVPNVEHWSIAHALLSGGFAYHTGGLFDRAHLRWFGLDSMHRALTEVGLQPLDVQGRVFDAADSAGFVQKIGPALQALGIDPAAYQRRAAPLQYIWRAAATATPTMLVQSTMLEPVGGVSDVRVIQPMQALAREPGFDARILPRIELAPVLSETPRIFIFHRPCLVGDQGLEILRKVHELGYVSVCEFDDHPDYLPVLQRDDVLNFSGVHAIQTTTPALAAVLAQRNPNVQVFANTIDRLEPPRNFANPGQMTLFFGGINRQTEWPELIPALNAVLREAGARLGVHVVADQAFFDALDTPHKQFTPLCDYATYKRILSGCEISLMPLRDTPFNRCKSDLKFLEAAAARVVALASPVVYGQSIQHAQTGLIFADAGQLEAQLRQLLDDPALALRIAEQARHHVSHHRMLAHQMAERAAWYRGLWSRRTSLDRALHVRHPELNISLRND